MTISVAIAEAGRVVRDDGADAPVPWWSFITALIAAAALALVRDGGVAAAVARRGRRSL
jgi:hypothetical protein